MSLQSAIEAELPFLRAEAEALMTLILDAYSPNGWTIDGDGYKVPAFTPEGSTFGKVAGPSAATADATTRFVTIGSVPKPVLAAGLHIPVSAPIPTAGEARGQGWEYVVTAVGGGADLELVGRRFLVAGVPIKSFETARRLDVVEV